MDKQTKMSLKQYIDGIYYGKQYYHKVENHKQ